MRYFVYERVSERITDGVAVGAITSPFWLDIFAGISGFFAGVLPIAGVIWIAYQMYTHYKDRRDGV